MSHRAVAVQADGELIDRCGAGRAGVRKQCSAVDHQAGVAHGVALGGFHPCKAHRCAGGSRLLERAEGLGQRKAAARRKVHVLVHQQMPGMAGTLGAAGIGRGGAVGALHADDLGVHLAQAGRARDIEFVLPGPVHRHDHAEGRARTGAAQRFHRPLATHQDHLVAAEVVHRGLGGQAERLRGFDDAGGEVRLGQLDPVLVLQVRQPTGVEKGLEGRRRRIEAHVRRVQQAHRVVADVAGHEALDHREVPHVGQAADDLRVRRGQVVQGLEHACRLRQVLEQVADHDHVEATGVTGQHRQVGHVEIQFEHAVQVLRRRGGGVVHQLHAPPGHAGVKFLEAPPQPTIGATEFQHALRMGRHRLQQLLVETVVVVAHGAQAPSFSRSRPSDRCGAAAWRGLAAPG